MGWRAHQRIKITEKCVLNAAWLLHFGFPAPVFEFPLTVSMIRIAPRPLDDDNLQGAFKYIRDEIARCLGLSNDAGPEVKWRYAQEKGGPKKHAVRIEIE